MSFFTFSLATEKLFDAMNGSSVPANYEIDEFLFVNSGSTDNSLEIIKQSKSIEVGAA